MRALTIGGVVHDVIAVIADTAIERMTLKNDASSFLLVEAGKKVDTDAILEGCGGGAANAGVCLTRLGYCVHILGKTGDDTGATFVRESLAADGVGLGDLGTSPDKPTGTSVILTAHERDPAVFVNRGANTALTCADVAAADFSSLDLVCITSLSGASAECFGDAAARAKAAGAEVLAIPGIRQLSSRGDELLAALKNIDTLIINKHEAAQLVPMLVRQAQNSPLSVRREGAPHADESHQPTDLLHAGLENGGFVMAFTAFAAALHEAGLRTLIVTDGGRGSWASRDGTLTHTPIVPAEIAATLGAGDSFASTYAGLICLGWDNLRALRGAALNAASVVGKLDTQSGLLPIAELEARIAKTEIVQRFWRVS